MRAGLAGMDVVHLGLFEIGRDPEIADLGDHQQLLAGVDAFADFGRSFQNDARRPERRFSCS